MKETDRLYRTLIEQNPEENAKAAHEIRAFLKENGLLYHDNIIRTLHTPKVFRESDIKVFQSIVKTTYGIFEKIIRAYLSDASFRKLFPFDGLLKELILTPRGYDSVLPIARFDIFYNEEDSSFRFCEINTDGTSAMNEDRVLNLALAKNPAHAALAKTHRFRTFELFDSWVRTFRSIYQTYKHAVEYPHVAIVDFLDGVEYAEFEEFQRHFEAAGLTCELCEVTKLTYRNHRLISPSGKPIDVVYRRAVTTDLIEKQDQVRPFLEAVKNEDVCIIGAFCTQIVHNKWLFHLLHEDAAKALLTDEECAFIEEHVPTTGLLSHSDPHFDEVLQHKNRYIIKPLDSYASKGVFAGVDCTEDEWKRHVHEFAGETYIYQEYCPPYRNENIDFIEESPKFAPYSNMTGLYVYNGEFAGIYSRCSGGAVISSQYNERDLASLVIEN